MAVTCPHCEEEIEVRIESQAAVTPRTTLPFTNAEEFALWLKASSLSLDEFQRLPVYEWQRDQLEPLVRALADSGAAGLVQDQAELDELTNAPKP
jgi:hypothetical protein